VPPDGCGRKTGNPVLRLPGRYGKKGCAAGNITLNVLTNRGDVPAPLASKNGRALLRSSAPKRDGKDTFFIRYKAGQPEKFPAGRFSIGIVYYFIKK